MVTQKMFSSDLSHFLGLRVLQLIRLHLGFAFIQVLFPGGLLPKPSIDGGSFGEWILSPMHLYNPISTKTYLEMQLICSIKCAWPSHMCIHDKNLTHTGINATAEDNKANKE